MRLIKFVFTVLFIVFGVFVVQNTFAFGSKEKSPEEQAAEQEKNAVKEYNDGVKHMEKAREKVAKGDSTYAFNYRATTDAKAKKEYDKAIGKFKKAVSLKPNFPEAYNNIGYCFRKLGGLNESLAAYHKALELKPNFPQAHEYLGETYLALDSMDQANGQLQLLQELKSPYADTLMKAIDLYKLSMVKEKMNESATKK